MSLAPSLKNRVKRLEATRGDRRALSISERRAHALARLAHLTPEQLDADDQQQLAEAHETLAEPAVPEGSARALHQRLARAIVRSHHHAQQNQTPEGPTQ